MMPTTSWPGMKACPEAPVYCSWSVPHRPQASTRRIPVSDRTAGTGCSTATRCRGASSTRARTGLSHTVPHGRRAPSDEEQHRRRQAIKGIFPATPFMGLLGITFDRYEPDDVVVRLPFHERAHQ